MNRYLFLFCLFFAVKTAAQVSGRAVVDSTHLSVGDQLRLRIEVKASVDAALLPIDLSAISADSTFEVLTESKWDTLDATGKELEIKKELLLIAWDSGLHRIGAIPLAYKMGERNDTFYTKDIPIQIDLPQVDTTLADIKPIVEESLTLEDFVWYIVGVVALMLVIFLVVLLSRRKKQVAPPPAPVIPLLPHEFALQQLDKLEEQQLWQNGHLKAYHSALTFLVREYLEGRYHIQALEQTTDEILQQLRKGDFDFSLSQKLGDVLQTADLVKFAKAQPTADFHIRAMATAREFIQETKPPTLLPTQKDGA